MEINMNINFWQGKHVRLRAHRPEDWEMKYQEFVDTETRRLLEYEVELPRSADDYARVIAENCAIEQGNRLSFAIENLDGEFVGWLNLHGIDKRNGTFGCGMSIFTTYQKMGYGEEALRILLRYAFLELRLQKCNASCLETNLGSLKLQKRLGFVDEGRRRRVVYTDGRFYDTILTGLTREEFELNDAAYCVR